MQGMHRLKAPSELLDAITTILLLGRTPSHSYSTTSWSRPWREPYDYRHVEL